MARKRPKSRPAQCLLSGVRRKWQPSDAGEIAHGFGTIRVGGAIISKREHLIAPLNRVQLQQVIFNLVTNAIEAMSSTATGSRILYQIPGNVTLGRFP